MKRAKVLRTALLVSFIFLILARSAASADQGFEPRPVPLGTTGGNIKDMTRSFCCGGTLGSLVQDGNGALYILSNNHVLARTNRGLTGDVIIQPALLDQVTACSKDVADSVSRISDFVRLSFKTGTENRADAAIAEIQPGKVDSSGAILNIGEISTIVTSPSLRMAVQKNGRTTGLTHGIISAIDVTIDIQYDRACGSLLSPRQARFTGQIMIGPGDFSSAGDSGSLIVEDCSPHPGPVGLLFAGNGANTIANPIGDALSALGVSMVGTNDSCSTVQTGSLDLAPPAISVKASGVEHAIQVKRRNEAKILRTTKRKGVIGIGVGYCEPDGVVIEVYAKKKHSKNLWVDETMEDVPVKLIEMEQFVAY